MNKKTPATPETPAKPVRKLTVEITDHDAIADAYPGCVDTVQVVNRQKLYPIVKALYKVGMQVPGCKAYYADEVDAVSKIDIAPAFAKVASTAVGSHIPEAAEEELRDVPEHLKKDKDVIKKGDPRLLSI